MPIMTTRPAMPLRLAASVLLLGCLPALLRAQGAPAVSVIPYPASASVDSSVRFTFGPTPVVALSAPTNAELRALGEVAADILRQELGARPRVATSAAGSTPSAVSLTLAPRDSASGAESYRLDVTGHGVAIRAPRAAGLFYGLQTLRALLEAERARTETAGGATRAAASLRGVHIADAPRVSYPRLPLGVGRALRPGAFVE